ncbi:MAG: hypothetical protein ACK46G_03925, partial [Flavobacteriales bacterium]
AHTAHVQGAGGAGGETDADAHGGGALVAGARNCLSGWDPGSIRTGGKWEREGNGGGTMHRNAPGSAPL